MYSDNTTAIADWVEAELYFENKEISRSFLYSQLTSFIGEDIEEDQIADVWLELEKRVQRIEINSISMTDSIIRYDPSTDDNAINEALLCFSIAYYKGFKNIDRKLFEYIAAHAIQSYFNGEVIINGFPPDKNVPKSFTDRVKFIAASIGCQIGDLPDSDMKDGSVDVVLWKKPAETTKTPEQCKIGSLVVLNQCASGKNWDMKLNEISIDLWRRYILFHVVPIKSFTLPFMIPVADWNKISSTFAGVLLDRARIVNVLKNSSIDNSHLIKRCKSWVSHVKAQL